jgi:hypothetical protein
MKNKDQKCWQYAVLLQNACCWIGTVVLIPVVPFTATKRHGWVVSASALYSSFLVAGAKCEFSILILTLKDSCASSEIFNFCTLKHPVNAC